MKTIPFLMFFLCAAFCQCCMAVDFKNCHDDPGLNDLPLILENIANGKRPDVPLEMTPASFIRLQPAARKILGRDILVCGIPLTSKGLPAIRLETDFSDIWDAIQFAAGMEDWENVEFIRDCVRAKKMPLAGLWSLFARPQFGDRSMRRLADILGIPPQDNGWDFYVLDAYAALGGYAEKPEKVVIGPDTFRDYMPDKIAWLESRKIPVTLMPNLDDWQNDLSDYYKSLSRVGIRLGKYYEIPQICQ